MLEITNLTKQKVDKALLKKVFLRAAAVLGSKRLQNISLVFIGDEKMEELNKKYRHKDRITDVLSFEELNEIFICLPQAKRQAKLLKTPLQTELTRLLVHGIVHLKGYEHEGSKAEMIKMQDVENRILANLGRI